MRCGNCKDEHPTTADIRQCYVDAGKIKDQPVNKVNDAQGPMWPPSDAQVRYVLGLYDERELPANHAVLSEDAIRQMEKDQVSAEINLLKTYPWKDRRASDTQPEFTMPEGRYALYQKAGMSNNPEATWQFFKISRSDKPRWKGYTFIKRLVGSVGDYQEMDMTPRQRAVALVAIEKDPRKAAADYGKQTQHCGRCGSPLTHKRSRAAGYGEKCAGALGWEW